MNAVARVHAIRTGPRTSPTPSAIEPHAGAAKSPTKANQPISRPMSWRSSRRDARYSEMYGKYAPTLPNSSA